MKYRSIGYKIATYHTKSHLRKFYNRHEKGKNSEQSSKRDIATFGNGTLI
jgi:hypothetical protein